MSSDNQFPAADMAQIFDNLSLLVACLDRQARVIYANKALCTLTGWTEAELLGREWFDTCVPQERRAPMRGMFRSHISRPEEMSAQHDNELLTRTGERRLIQWSTSFSRAIDGSSDFILIIGTDITVQRRLSGELTKSEAKFRLLFNNISEAVYLFSVGDGNACSTFIEVNDASCRMTGYTRDELLNMRPHDISPAALGELGADDICARTLQNGGEISEMIHLAKDGRQVPVEVMTRVFEMESARYVLALARDITERRSHEAALKNALAQTEEANLAKSRFIATVSHELRTPLNAVLGMTELFSETRLTTEQERYLNILRHAGRTMLELTSDILDLSKIEAGRIDLEPTPSSLRSLAESVTDIARAGAAAKKLPVALDIGEGTEDWVLCDTARVRQILLNLLSNAVKFTDTGRVTLEVSSVTSGQAAEFFFRVTDTGPGIAQDKLSCLFDRFSTANVTLSRKHGGTGLGLFISRELAHLMKGEITVRSVVGKGSIFTFRVPFTLTAQQYKNETAPEPVQAANALSILLADDSRDNQFLIAAYLRHTPHHITPVDTGAQAVEQFMTGRYDLILMDMLMPEMDGYEAARRIRQEEKRLSLKSHIPIVAMTAYAMKEDCSRALEAGCDEYLSKPVFKGAFLEMMTRFAAKKHG